ncbi:hypothetical protein [Roseivirga misakiensis]|uniref:Uncharacterized protein n=1 Tax=Roseivirga misakiensis TaxID=1563681 RepID=A0A1E5SYP2_9BACT|nr:hypothetical protein [Roseivirga misakiensis]OEK04240.1 hypothetical protein BFP71_12205 [Roseivirga misakiensis]
MGILNKLFGNKKAESYANDSKSKDFPPKPKWKPNPHKDLNIILEKAKYYTKEKLQIAVFEYGTVVIFPEQVTDIESSAKVTLDKIYKSHPDFNPRKMDDDNYLIEYTQPAFTIVFKEEIDSNWDYIDENHQDGICRDEVLINALGQRNVFDKVGKICLYGRSKMFMDAQFPKVLLKFDKK